MTFASTGAARSVMRTVYNLIPREISVPVRSAWQFRWYQRRYGKAGQQRPHDLPGELVVSLTSYPPRFPTLHLTLHNLLDQTVRPDRVVLSVAEGDEELLPPRVRALIGNGVELRVVPDVRSFKKLVFAVQEWPDAFIVTADDDNFYPSNWLEQLVNGFDPANPAIICHRAHRLPMSGGDRLPPYDTWENDVQDAAARTPSRDLVAVGLGGIFYPPRSLHPDVTDQEAFSRLCPRADDLWFYWCARRVGTLYKKVGGRFPALYWASSQDVSLFTSNMTENDVQARRLIEAYGNPVTWPEPAAG